jgi:hypothetical protein
LEKKRPKHPKRKLEKVIRDAEDKGWRFRRGNTYYVGYCPCGKHMKTVHLSPSTSRYEMNLRKWFERNCWE